MVKIQKSFTGKESLVAPGRVRCNGQQYVASLNSSDAYLSRLNPSAALPRQGAGVSRHWLNKETGEKEAENSLSGRHVKVISCQLCIRTTALTRITLLCIYRRIWLISACAYISTARKVGLISQDALNKQVQLSGCGLIGYCLAPLA